MGVAVSRSEKVNKESRIMCSLVGVQGVGAPPPADALPVCVVLSVNFVVVYNPITAVTDVFRVEQ